MRRILLALALAALLAAPAGTAHAATSPAAYRTKLNGLCTQAKRQLGAAPSTSSASSAELARALQRATGIFEPILASTRGIVPPPEFAAAHRRIVTSLQQLVALGRTLLPKLTAGTDLETALTPLLPRVTASAAGLSTSFAQLGLTTCSRLLSGDSASPPPTPPPPPPPPPPASPSSPPPSATPTVQQALTTVLAIVKRNAAACGITSWRVSVSGTAPKYVATATLTGRASGTARWNVVSGRAVAADQLAAEIEAGCP
jgi:hypothetical protein